MIKYQPTTYASKYLAVAHNKYNSRQESNEAFNRSKMDNSCNFNTVGQSQLTIEHRVLARQRVQSKLNLHKQNKENQILKPKYRNAEKLKHFQQLKQSNIDDLNCKIKKMITKLALQDNQNKPCAKVEELKDRRRHERFKTDYENFSSNLREQELFGKVDSHCQQKNMIESEIIQNIAETTNFQRYSKKRMQNNNVEQIRRKYKDGDSQCREFKGGSSKDSFGANSKANDTFRSGNGTLNADLIRFRQKIKENNQRQRRQLSNELEFQYRQTLKKDDSLNRLHLGKRKNVDDDLARYNKRIENYNSKKMVTLPDQDLYQRLPLREATTRFNNQFTFVPFQVKKMEQKKVNQIQSLHPKIKLKLRTNKQKLSVDESQPLTADFRYKEQEPMNELRLLLENLMKQVKLDEIFRKGKKWFERQTSSVKWGKLQQCLQSKKVNLDECSIREIFSPTEEQDDPFYSPRQTQFSIESLAATFVECESNWFQNVIKKYNSQKLTREGFVLQKLDCSGKGYIEIEDIVRFINLEMDAEIRNRDVFLVFERLKSEEQLTFQDVIQVICY